MVRGALGMSVGLIWIMKLFLGSSMGNQSEKSLRVTRGGLVRHFSILILSFWLLGKCACLVALGLSHTVIRIACSSLKGPT